jgi:hypothetical protein
MECFTKVLYFLTDAHHATLNNLLRELVEGVEEHFGKALHHIPILEHVI